MPQVFLRIFVSPNADVSNLRIEWDLYAANQIFSRLAGFNLSLIQPPNNSSAFQPIPSNVDITIKEFLNNNSIGQRSLQLLDYNPDGFARDGRVISIYYLSGDNDFAQTNPEVSCKNDRLTFPVLSATVMPSSPSMPNGPSFNTSSSRFLLAHEILHSLFARVVEDVTPNGIAFRTINDDNPDQESNGSHSTKPENLLFTTTPSSQSFVQTGVLPPNLLTQAQINKAQTSPFVLP